MSLFGASPLPPPGPVKPDRPRAAVPRRVAPIHAATRDDDIVEVEHAQNEDPARSLARNNDENASEDRQEHAPAEPPSDRPRLDIAG